MGENELTDLYDQVNLATMQQKMKLENQLKAGANWFYWIAGLSLINSLIFLFNGSMTFVVGLGITQFVDGIMMGIVEFLGSDGSTATLLRVIGLIINTGIAGMFAGFGYLGRKWKRWAFITGMVLYGLDVLLLIWVQDIFSILFHFLALAGLYKGMKAINDIKSLENNPFGG